MKVLTFHTLGYIGRRHPIDKIQLGNPNYRQPDRLVLVVFVRSISRVYGGP